MVNKNIENYWNNMSIEERIIFSKDLECTRDYRNISLFNYSELFSIEKFLLNKRYNKRSIIKIKLSKILTLKEFKKLQIDLWEYFGDIQKEDIKINYIKE